MNNIVGLSLFFLSSLFTGALLGGLFGFLSTATNNIILSPYFGAAIGSYRWWILFHSRFWALGLGIISICWGLFLAYKGSVLSGTIK